MYDYVISKCSAYDLCLPVASFTMDTSTLGALSHKRDSGSNPSYLIGQQFIQQPIKSWEYERKFGVCHGVIDVKPNSFINHPKFVVK